MAKKSLVKKAEQVAPSTETKATVPATPVEETAKKATRSAIKKAEPKADTPAKVEKPKVQKKVEAPTPAPTAPVEKSKAEKPAEEKKGLQRTALVPESKFKPVMESKRFRYVKQTSFTEEQLKEGLFTGEFPVRVLVDEGLERVTELVVCYILDGTIHSIDTTVKGANRNSHVPFQFKDLNFSTGKFNGLEFALYMRETKEEEESAE